MITKMDNRYHKKLMEYLKKEPEFNLFIVGDIERFGYDNDFLEIWSDINKYGKIEGVLVRYFSFLTFYSCSRFDASRFSKFINGLNYIEISGKKDCLDKLEKGIKINKKRVVKFCKLTNDFRLKLVDRNIKIKKMRFGNIGKVNKLYEIIDEFENTSTEGIKSMLKTGRGYYIEENKQIVAMIKSTLENKKYALIVGVGTHPNYRNKGYATLCISKMCRELLGENKIPCLFYDNEKAGGIYKKLGFEEIGDWTILSR